MGANDTDTDPRQLGESLVHLLGLLVDEPESMQVHEEIERSGDSTFEVRMPSRDLGKLIGRQGRTARALRVFLGVRGTLDRRRHDLEIREL